MRKPCALHLLGNALHTYLGGDILKRDTLDELIDEYDEVGRHALKVMQAYKKWLKDTPELQLLYLLGLFDHPIEIEVLEVLWKEQIPSLTEKIHLKAWKIAIRDLREKHRLLSTHEDRADLLDCHPLIREYFGKQLKQSQPKAWQQAHKKLYEYYKGLPKKLLPDTLEEMRPLFNAVRHGCAAGLHNRVITEVYYSRIERKETFYNVNSLGAFNDDLAVIAAFFETVWHTPSSKLKAIWQLRLLGYAGFCLRALGRLHEAQEAMHANIEMAIHQRNWGEAALGANNLSELQLTLGEIAQAQISSQRSMNYANQSGDWFERLCSYSTHANTLHQSGAAPTALALFQEAEQLQKKHHSKKYPRFYSLASFHYCDLLLAQNNTMEVLNRAEYSLGISTSMHDLLSIAFDQLSLGQSYFQQKNLPQAIHWLNQAVAGFLAAGTMQYLPRGLLTRSALHRHTGNFDHAHKDLQEVFDIATPSRMRLHLTDYHLEMARLIFAEGKGDSQPHIETAETLIEETGYHRRDTELAELKAQLLMNQQIETNSTA